VLLVAVMVDPAVAVNGPEKELAPPRLRLKVPCMVRPPEPLMAPLYVRLAPGSLTVTVPLSMMLEVLSEVKACEPSPSWSVPPTLLTLTVAVALVVAPPPVIRT
jgi:hypothetical protein